MTQMRSSIVFMLLLLLVGCASSGNEKVRNETKENLEQQIQKGKSSKQNVQDLFGDPDEISFTDSGNEIWRFRHSVATSKPINFVPYANIFSHGMDVKNKMIVFMFDKKGIVQNYTFSDSKNEVKNGLFDN